ncbi:MAG TPA: polysaccharide deacetylase family protein [Acidimicrobiales bacterium]|nr:polysaccharide deacetylase family protein [Acidimicrobiales bacterium]
MLVTFDYEGCWGMPFEARYDQDRSTGEILRVLAAHGVAAVFFVVGKLAEERPDLVKELFARGHQIGLHGYRHEHFELLTPPARAELRAELEGACRAVEAVTGERPVAYRSPYLLGRRHHDDGLAPLLAATGFGWTSDREVRFCEELFRPDRVPLRPVRAAAARAGLFGDRGLGALAAVALNAAHLGRETALPGAWGRARWLLGGRRPFRRAGLWEVALQAPLDCDLLGLARPDEDTPEEMLDFAAERLAGGCERAGEPYVLSFHDWIVGTKNRPRLLDEVFARLGALGAPLVDAVGWRP